MCKRVHMNKRTTSPPIRGHPAVVTVHGHRVAGAYAHVTSEKYGSRGTWCVASPGAVLSLYYFMRRLSRHPAH